MNKTLQNKCELPSKLLPILSDKEAGERYNKWSFPYVYYLNAFRDIYILTQVTDIKSLKNITKIVNEHKIQKKDERWKAWTERDVLEYLNGLVKFGLLDSDYKSKGNFFLTSIINTDLTKNEIDILKNIFFEYFRFKELSSWFVAPDGDANTNLESLSKVDFIYNSNPLYFHCERNRFTDTFFTDIETCQTKYIIESDTLMRFWDVYLKWGLTLNILNKFNISKSGEKLRLNKEISVAYFTVPFGEFDFIDFIDQNFNSKHIFIPELIFKIIKKYRYSVNEIKSYIVDNILNNSKLTYERTSEIFLIKGKTSKKNIEAATYLFPKINNSFVSHLILRK